MGWVMKWLFMAIVWVGLAVVSMAASLEGSGTGTIDVGGDTGDTTLGAGDPISTNSNAINLSASVANSLSLTVTDDGSISVDPSKTAIDQSIGTLTVNNNDSDGFTIAFSSNNDFFLKLDGFTPSGNVTGHQPSEPYSLTLQLTEGSFGVPTADVTINKDSTDLNFQNPTKATNDGTINVQLSQTADQNLFHGAYSDVLTISLSDN